MAALTLLLFIAAWHYPDVLELSFAAFALALAFGIYFIMQKR
jgi:EamA domain-containing membrane protein RarD